VTKCQNGLPLSVSDVSKLAEKFEIAQTAEAVANDKAAATNDKAAATNDKAAELQKVSELLKELPSRRSDLSQKF